MSSKLILGSFTVDLDDDPFLPDDWGLIEHCADEEPLIWTPDAVGLYLSPNQRDGNQILGRALYKELVSEGVPFINANLLDFLLAHPECIPKEWVGVYVSFLGTTYCDADGGHLFRCLDWPRGFPHWRADWLDDPWDDRNPALVHAAA